jgi:hypothetical protein
MANNFRLSGTYYISKDGNDANSGLSADLPKATLARYAATAHIIGAGVYKGAFNLSTNAQNTIMYPDGAVVINCTAGLNIGQTSGGSSQIYGQTSQQYFIRIELNTFNLSIGIGTNNFNQIIFKNGVISPTTNGGTHNFTRCVLNEITSPTVTTSLFNFSYSQIYNSVITMPNTSSITNSYVDEASVISMSSYFSSPSTQFRYSNFRGIFNINGTLYELKQDKDGNPIDPNPSIADLITIDATVYDRGNFAQDPEFLNIEKQDYWAVSATSPMLFADSTAIGNIAMVYFANLVKATDTEFADGAITDLEYSANDFIVDSPATFGYVVSEPIQDAPIPQAWGRMTFGMAFNFNSDLTLGTTENNNVTIVDNFADGTAGANPRRLTYEMRWSNKSTIPLVDADWDNQGYITAGDYAKFEINTKPMIDPSGLGNGDPSFVSTGAVGLKWKWRQMRITVRNGIG